MTGSAWRRAAPWLVAAGGYAALTLVMTWPLALRLSSVLPHDLGDPILNTWILWWSAHALPLTASWWNAPMFWPLEGALGLSEHLLGLSLIATPLQWAGADPVTAYNIVFLLSFPSSAIAAHALAFELTGRHDAAAVAGLIFGFNPYRTAEIAHIQMLWAFWMPLALVALHRYARSGERRWLVMSAAMWLGQAASNGYYLLFFPVLVLCWIVWFLLSRGAAARAGMVGAAWAIASVPLLPIAVAYARIQERYALSRTLDEIRGLSADLHAFVSTSPQVWAWSALSETHRSEQQLFPGVTALALIVAAAVLSIRRNGRPQARHARVRIALAVIACLLMLTAAWATLVGPWRLTLAGATIVSVGAAGKPLTIAIWCGVAAMAAGPRFGRAVETRSAFAFYTCAAVLMYVFCLGPQPAFSSTVFWYKPPYAWLLHLPGFSTVRVPARFAMLAELCLAIAAAIAFARLVSRASPRAAHAAAAAAICAVLADSWAHALPLPALPERLASLEASGVRGAVVELPLGDVGGDTAAIYRSMYHRRPLVNGYSGFVPPPYTLLRLALDEGEIDALDAFRGDGPLTVVVDPRTSDRQWNRAAAHAGSAWSPAGHGLMSVTWPAVDRHDGEPPGERLSIRSAAGSTGAIDLMTITDGDPLSRWDSGSPQRGNEWVVLDLGTPHRVTGVTIDLGPYLGGYPREVAIDGSLDGQRWTTRFEGRSAARAVWAARRNPRVVPLAYPVTPADARWIRLRQTGSSREFHWTMSEVAVYGRERTAAR